MPSTTADTADPQTVPEHGAQAPFDYLAADHALADGGHYEHVGLYELLRRARGIRLIVACDCGCDPRYPFEDLANLMRMVRIDFAAEMEVDTRITHNRMLGAVFGVPEDFRSTEGLAAQKCALLLNVYHSKMSYRAHRPDARVVVAQTAHDPHGRRRSRAISRHAPCLSARSLPRISSTTKHSG